MPKEVKTALPLTDKEHLEKFVIANKSRQGHQCEKFVEEMNADWTSDTCINPDDVGYLQK